MRACVRACEWVSACVPVWVPVWMRVSACVCACRSLNVNMYRCVCARASWRGGSCVDARVVVLRNTRSRSDPCGVVFTVSKSADAAISNAWLCWNSTPSTAVLLMKVIAASLSRLENDKISGGKTSTLSSAYACNNTGMQAMHCSTIIRRSLVCERTRPIILMVALGAKMGRLLSNLKAKWSSSTLNSKVSRFVTTRLLSRRRSKSGCSTCSPWSSTKEKFRTVIKLFRREFSRELAVIAKRWTTNPDIIYTVTALRSYQGRGVRAAGNETSALFMVQLYSCNWQGRPNSTKRSCKYESVLV